jgi:ParB family chromosome partitioning protein
VLSAGHARALVAVSNSEIQDRLAQRVVAEGLSVRALEEIVTVEPDGKRRPARRSGAKLHSPRVAELAGRLSDRFDTRVKVDLGRSKGRITVEFATVEDLERIVELMDPRRHKR